MTPRQKTLLDKCLEFFAEEPTPRERQMAKRIALWLMGRRKGLTLTEEEQDALWYIQRND